MNITNEAKEVLLNAMEENKSEGIRFFLNQGGCCGPQIGVSLDSAQATDKVEEINGVSVAFDTTVISMTDDVTLDVQDGGLVLVGVPDSGCC
ncbi:MAG: adhesin [Bacillota bacterium]